MDEGRLKTWVHTRGTSWDYKWFSSSSDEPPFPGGKARVVRCLTGSEPGSFGAVAVCLDGLRITVAAGGYSGRKDRHARRIQQHVVLSQIVFGSPSPLVAAIVAAVESPAMTALVDRLANKEFGHLQCEEAMVRLVLENCTSAPLEGDAQLAMDPRAIELLRSHRALLCISPGMPLRKVWTVVFGKQQLPQVPFCVAAGVADPIAFDGLAGVISTGRPLLEWGATAGGQYVLFAGDGERSLHQPEDLLASIRRQLGVELEEHAEPGHRGVGRLIPAASKFLRGRH